MMKVIYEDKDIVIINKPPGISTHGGPQVEGKTLVDFLLKEFPEIRDVGENPTRPGIVHRLDKDTSGIMVVARTAKSFLRLKELFQNRQVEKKYVAVVCGAVRGKKGIVSLPIGRLQKNPLKRGVEHDRARIRGAREAETHYQVLKQGKQFSLVELMPKTGRMHQLRVHMKALGHPIACDMVYGGKNVCCPGGTGRQLLHARSLSFSFAEGKRFTFEADVPEDFRLAEKAIL